MNYADSTGSTPPSAWCVVYDASTGQVVHLHGFTGFDLAADTDWARDMRGQTALAHVRLHVRKDGTKLAVAHGDPKKLPQPGAHISFDLKKKKLVVTGEPTALRSLRDQDAAPHASKKKR